jgi:hypothetical protein
MPFRIPFAGEGESFTPDSVLSHCYGALLPMFNTKEAITLRQLCREFGLGVKERGGVDFSAWGGKTLHFEVLHAWDTLFEKKSLPSKLYAAGSLVLAFVLGKLNSSLAMTWRM